MSDNDLIRRGDALAAAKGFIGAETAITALPAADVKVLVEALLAVDALDPEGMIDGCSQAALRGLVLRMGHIARAALAEIEGEKP